MSYENCLTRIGVSITIFKLAILFIFIAQAYDAKHGVPTSATPKVFMKYFFVNTVTGEKSGEMMAVVTLTEDAGE